jgi:electron transfer flavoprotein alpha subunit
MSSSDIIAAMNKDTDAPIFEIAGSSIVGNLFALAPAIIEEIKRDQAEK